MKRKKKGVTDQTIKCCLKKHLKDKNLLPVIEEYIDHISRLTYRGSLIFNHFLRWCIEKDHCNPTRNRLSEFINCLKNTTYETFIRACFLLGTDKSKYDGCSKKIDILEEFWGEKEQFYFTIGRLKGDYQLITYAVQDYVTAFKNMKFRVNSFQIEYIKQWGEANNVFTNKKKDEIHDIRSKVNGWNFEMKTNILEKEGVMTFIDEQRIVLGIHGTKFPITWSRDKLKLSKSVDDNETKKQRMSLWIDEHMENVLRYQNHILSYFEQRDVEKFNMAPICDMRRNFIMIDIAILYDMLKKLDLVQVPRWMFVDVDSKQNQFRDIFKIDKYIGSKENPKTNKKITSFQTDGIALCIHMEVCKEKDNQHDENPRPTKKHRGHTVQNDMKRHESIKRIISIDPGRTVLICGLEYDCELGEYTNKYRYTRRQYYHESHIDQNNKKIAKWQKQIQNVEDRRKNVTSKTSSIVLFEEFLNVIRETFNDLYAHYSKKRYGMLRMDNYIHKRKSIDKFFYAMKFGYDGPANTKMKNRNNKLPEPTIAYGNGSFGATGKNEKTVPVKWIKEHCCRRFKHVIEVDEKYTTANCHRCGSKLQDFTRCEIHKGGVYDNKNTVVRGLKWCCSTKCSKTRIVSRDMNASKNILSRFLGTERESFMQKASETIHCYESRDEEIQFSE